MTETTFRLCTGWGPVRRLYDCHYGLQTCWTVEHGQGRGKWQIVNMLTGEVVKHRGGYLSHGSMTIKGMAALRVVCEGEK